MDAGDRLTLGLCIVFVLYLAWCRFSDDIVASQCAIQCRIDGHTAGVVVDVNSCACLDAPVVFRLEDR